MSKHFGFGEQIQNALTARQIAAVLDAVLVSEKMDVRGFLERLAKTDPDAARIVDRLLTSGKMDGSPAGKESSLSKDKLLEQWSGLWAEWDDIVSEVGDEDGRYAEQDAHWEPAFFDSAALATDLEQVAEKMLSALEEVVLHLDQPRELFSEALAELESGIDGYPEWMGVEYGEPCVLGAKTTTCILRWLWLHARNEDDPELRFLETFQAQLAELTVLELDRQTCGDFFANLSPEEGRRIHSHIRAGTFPVEEDASRWTIWDQVRYELDQRFDPDKYLATCRRKLADDWQYGLPLIEDAQAKGDLESLETWLTRTFSSLLRLKEDWRPEDTLIIDHLRYISRDQEKSIIRLLDIWADTAQAMGNPARAATARFQEAMVPHKSDIQVVLQRLADLQEPETEQVLNLLTEAWTNYLAYFSGCRGEESSWVHWLMEAARQGSAGRTYFKAKLGEWLAALSADFKRFRKEYDCLECLTADLADLGDLGKKYPGLIALLRGGNIDDPLHRSRRELLRAHQVQELMDDVPAVWRKHVLKMIPDPASARQSRYGHHARWMQALHELDQPSYERMLKTWRDKYHRRKNLWGEMRALGLPT